MRPAPLGGFHRLAVDNGRAWGRPPSTLHPKPLPQRFHHPFPNAHEMRNEVVEELTVVQRAKTEQIEALPS